MSRWSIVLALPLVMAAGIADEQTASACPTQQPARTARVVHAQARGSRNARVVRPSNADVPVAPVAPPSNPAASAAGSEGFNLARVNAFRSQAGLAPVTLDPTLSSFARAGSAQLMSDHAPHGHFRAAGDSMWKQGFTGGAAENQGSPTGWPRASADPTQNEQRQIDQILASMMGEGPNGGHYRNMMNPKAKRVGIGLIEDSGGKLYLTNDFSE
jgi:uncharacterized protein YkwD